MDTKPKGSWKYIAWSYTILVVLAVLSTSSGCTGSSNSEPKAYTSPETFREKDKEWILKTEWTKKDDQNIRRFFKTNSEMLNSPEWSGDSKKYVSRGPGGKTRYYWFAGPHGSPTWNCIEFSNRNFRNFSGRGILGNDSDKEKLEKQ